ncbi:MAG: T9SS type A sorting domain-containing protein [Candidatus Eisenbacteria bacterium]|nr:T9SS type A sorting domain-containing protein [Candidatus Eisenbacteria bacterium]
MKVFKLYLSAVGVFICLIAFSTPAAAVVTDCYQIQYGTWPVGTAVTVNNVVVTGRDLKPTTYGIWVQEQGGGAFSGVMVYCGANPPTVEIGDIVNVSGTTAEYPAGGNPLTVTEIDVPTITKVGTLGRPAPVLLATGDLGYTAADSAKAEKWEGVYLKLDNVVVVDISMGYGQYGVVEAHAHGSEVDTVWVGPKMLDPTPALPAVGDTFLVIQGIWSWEYGNYKIWPCNLSDIVKKGCPSPPNLVLAHSTSETGVRAYFDATCNASGVDITKYYLEDSSAAVISIVSASFANAESTIVDLVTGTQNNTFPSTLSSWEIGNRTGCATSPLQSMTFRGGVCPMWYVQHPKSALNDSSFVLGTGVEEVTVRGIVTGTTFPNEFFVQERQAGPWSGIAIYGSLVKPVVGDSVTVAGLVAEYYNKTELTSIDYVKIHSSGNPLPGPDVVTIQQVMTGAVTAESWEGSFVRLNNTTVADTTTGQGGEWRVWNGVTLTDTLNIGRDSYYRFYFCPTCTTFYPPRGMKLTLQGICDYTYSARKIKPRTGADLFYPTAVADMGETPGTLEFGLFQNVPNPFNPRTEIRFAVAKDSRVDLRVYDVAGRMVRTLLKGERVKAGVQTEAWDGRSDSGRELASGVYFYQLRAGDKVATMKMVLLR